MKSNDINIGIIGYGSVGKQLHNALLENDYSADQIYIFADDIDSNLEKKIYKFSEFKLEEFKKLHFIPALGYLSKNLKYELLDYLVGNNYSIFSFVHPTAFVSKTATIGRGVFIYPMCNIDQGAIIGDGCIIANSSIVAHDSNLGKCCYLGAMVCLSGFVEIGELTFIGSTASVSNNLKVGRNSTIATGTCLTKNIDENSFVIGNPFQYKNSIKVI
jgi:sugar O-acyltransferase (sialic acid O-acetyltransferase NeuD family)